MKRKNVRRLKLPNGFGSISYLGANRRKPFLMRAPAIYQDDGKAIRPIIGYKEDYYEAFEELIKYNKNPYDIDKQKITFEEIFTLWAEHEKLRNNKLAEDKKKKKPFADNYTSVFRNQCKKLHKERIMDITSAKIQHCIDECDKGHTTVVYIKLLCHKLLIHAKYLGLNIDVDTVKYLDIGTATVSKIHTNFTQEEKDLLWTNLNNKAVDPNGIIDTILITIYTGMRPSEMLNFEKEKIDLKRKYGIGGIKTKSGINREIPLHDRIIPLIEKRLKENDSKYLIVDKNNRKYNYDNYLMQFKKAMRNLNMHHLPHDGRDTTATELFNSGVKKLIYKLILGHSISDITERHYISVTIEQKLEAINTIQ